MKYAFYLAISLFLLSFSCKKKEIGFKNHEVHFYTIHKDYEVIPVKFETVTEQILIKSQHKKGASFKWVYDTTLIKDSYYLPRIVDSVLIPMVINSEASIAQDVVCYKFLESVPLDTIQGEYTVIIKQIIETDGTMGDVIPAQYITVQRKVIERPATLRVEENLDRQPLKVFFYISEDISIEEYLKMQFLAQNENGCKEGESYEIVK